MNSGIDVSPDVKAEYLFSESYVLYLHALGGRELNDYRRLNRSREESRRERSLRRLEQRKN